LLLKTHEFRFSRPSDLPCCGRFGQLQSGISYVAKRISGEVTIACVPSAVAYFLPAVLRTHHREYPGIRTHISGNRVASCFKATSYSLTHNLN
jgi:hypothetical protein